MKWIGLTGGLGTGKSSVAKIIREMGYIVLDADELAKEVVQPGTPGLKSVEKIFGQEFITSAGELDRVKMAKHVFSHPEALRDLENIIHPLVQAKVQTLKSEAQKKGAAIVFYDVPLLFEKNISGFNSIVVVTCRPELQFERLRLRNSWNDSEINRRLGNQLSMNEKLKRANHVIENNGTFAELRDQVRSYLSKIQIIG